jgi:shikimate kinase
MSRVAKELETYARKNGGIDKMDFMKAAMMMKKGQTNQLKKFVDDLDTEPREKILSLMQKDTDRRKDYKAFQKAKRNEDVEIDLEEGVNDPGIFKAVFLAGGPGSGKSFMVGKTALTTLGLKLINSDPAFEAQLKKVGLKPTPEDIFTDKGQGARAKAKRLTAKQQELALKGRLGLVIDGTGKDYDKIQKQAIALKKIGYEVGMIFVNTNLETAVARDAKRDRTLGRKEVTNMWNAVQDNIGKFQKFFGTGMIIVDNSDGADYESGAMTAYKKMSKWVSMKPKHPEAKKWIDSQKKSRGITEEDLKKIEESKKPLEYGTQETTDTFKKATPGEGAPQRFTQRIRESILRSRRRNRG